MISIRYVMNIILKKIEKYKINRAKKNHLRKMSKKLGIKVSTYDELFMVLKERINDRRCNS